MEIRSQEKGITSKYASLREELLREQNWVTGKISRWHSFLAGIVFGMIVGGVIGVLGTYGVLKLIAFYGG